MHLRKTTWLSGYVCILLAFALLDGIWLGMIAMPWYQEAFSTLLKEHFVTWPWILFYLGYGAAVMHLAVLPNLTQSIIKSVLAGCVLGAAAYGTYNLTGYSIIANWPLPMSLVDWVWGTFATGVLALVGSMVTRVLYTRDKH